MPKEEYRGKTLVYYSSSGSGKTSELVGSSASRESDLVVFITVIDPSPDEYERYEAISHRDPPKSSGEYSEQTSPCSQERAGCSAEKKKELLIARKTNMLAMDQQILPQVQDLIVVEQKHIRSLIDAVREMNRPLKVVLAINEASSCPRIIRGILRFPDYIHKLIDQAIKEGIEDHVPEFWLQTKISVCGTGIASSTIGSLPDQFVTLAPFHDEENWCQVIIDKRLSLNPVTVHVPWSATRESITNLELLKDRLPVLATLMQNGRMASIALKKLRQHMGTQSEEVISKRHLVHGVVRDFISSNGMSKISRNSKRQRSVAAYALAVHLFSHGAEFRIQVPKRSREVAEWASKMEFFKFATEENVSVKKLVTKYGLLEPSRDIDIDDKYNNEISPPLFMSIPQQLIAVFMLGIDSPTMLEPTWFGFELMSTHFVKCALAASAVVNNANQPSVKDVLGTIGFEVDDGVTSDNVKATWDSLEQWTAFLADAGSESTYHARTRQLDVGLKIVSNSTTPGKLLQIETQLLRALTQLEMFPGPGNKIFPIACVNEGNSDLCDGLVTFCAKKKDTEREVKKFTIMIQAKDYHETSRVDVGKMNGHAAKNADEVLGGVFGKTRMLCMASTEDALLAKGKTQIKRDYLPYVFPRGKLVKGLLKKLQTQ